MPAASPVSAPAIANRRRLPRRRRRRRAARRGLPPPSPSGGGPPRRAVTRPRPVPRPWSAPRGRPHDAAALIEGQDFLRRVSVEIGAHVAPPTQGGFVALLKSAGRSPPLRGGAEEAPGFPDDRPERRHAGARAAPA